MSGWLARLFGGTVDPPAVPRPVPPPSPQPAPTNAETISALLASLGEDLKALAALQPDPDELPDGWFAVGLVGESFFKGAVRAARPGDLAFVFHESGNPYDANALAVHNAKGEQLGYLPRDNWLYRAVNDEAQGCDARVWKCNAGADGKVGIVIAATLAAGAIGSVEYAR